MKNKILKTIPIFIAILIIIFSIFFIVRKIEAPVIHENYAENEINDTSYQKEIKNTSISTNNESEIKNPQNTKIDKYIIKDWSVVIPQDKNGNKKVVLLTIDDGPSTRTLEMVDILKKHGAKAIFFVNGIHDKNYSRVITKTYKEGFTIGNHTWSHLNLKKEKDISISEKEITRNSELIEKVTGSSPKFFRPPYGDSTIEIRTFVENNNMIFMDWSDAAKDWEKTAREKDIFITNVTNNLTPGSIILIHEHPWSLANLDALLDKLDSDGYSYVDPNNIVK